MANSKANNETTGIFQYTTSIHPMDHLLYAAYILKWLQIHIFIILKYIHKCPYASSVSFPTPSYLLDQAWTSHS